MPASQLPCLVCLKKWCETHQTLQQGRQALVSTGRRSLAALAVSRRRHLLSPRHAAGAVLARVRPASRVPSAVAVVAAVRLQLPFSHRLGVVATPPPHLNRFATHRTGQPAVSILRLVKSLGY